MIVISTIVPARAPADRAAASAKIKEPVALATVAATNAPIIYRDPWARLIKPITPKISVRPADIKNNIIPNCRPFRICSAIKTKDI
jgi:hypothetical protein